MSTPDQIQQVGDLERQFRSITERSRALADRLGEKQFSQRPVPGKWSAAECLVHLSLTSEAYFPLWREAFTSARARQLYSDRPFTLDFWGKTLAWFLEPPPKLRFPTSANFQPPESRPPGEALKNFVDCQERLLEAVAGARGLALDRIRITSPFARQVRYSAWSSFVVSAVHQRRHLWQAERAADVLQQSVT